MRARPDLFKGLFVGVLKELATKHVLFSRRLDFLIYFFLMGKRDETDTFVITVLNAASPAFFITNEYV